MYEGIGRVGSGGHGRARSVSKSFEAISPGYTLPAPMRRAVPSAPSRLAGKCCNFGPLRREALRSGAGSNWYAGCEGHFAGVCSPRFAGNPMRECRMSVFVIHRRSLASCPPGHDPRTVRAADSCRARADAEGTWRGPFALRRPGLAGAPGIIPGYPATDRRWETCKGTGGERM